jgi:tetratricopeptide (TPR) repeat protein
MPPLPCPSEETLVAFVDGALPPPERHMFEAHLARCAVCFEVVSVLAGGTLPTGPHAPAPVLARGTPLGRYLVLERVGAGAMGVVYAAYDPELDRKVAVKVLHSSLQGAASAEARRTQVRREAQALARLSHPCVVSIFDVGGEGALVYLTMAWVDGVTLRQWLSEHPRSWREVLEVLRSAGEGLSAAHTAGIIHRDVKPDNVMVGRDGRVYVTDFGLARLAEAAGTPGESRGQAHAGEGLTRTGVAAGTPAYMAPEQLSGAPASALTDQYAFCVTLWEALHGERPGSNGARSPPGMPAGVRRVLQQGLSADPHARHPSVAVLLEALQRAAYAPARRRRALLTAAGLGVLALGPTWWALNAQVQMQAGLCPDPVGHLAGAWDDAGRMAIARSFLDSGKPYAASALASTQAALDVWAGEWVRVRQRACRATRVLAEQNEEVLGLKLSCLDKRLLELRALTGVLQQADGTVVQSAVQAVGSLGPPAVCEDVEALRAEVKPPTDAETRRRVEQVREALSLVEALARAGKYQEAQQTGEPLVERARALGYPPLLAEVLFLVGFAAEKRYDTLPAAAALEEAVWLSQGSRHDRYAARAAIRLSAVHFRDSRWEQAAQWARFARASVERLGGEGALEAELENVIGAGASIRFDEKQALVHFTRAYTLARKALGPEHPETLTYRSNTLLPLLGLGRVIEAREELEKMRQLQQRHLGTTHPQLIYLLFSLLSAHRLLGQRSEAEAVLGQLRNVTEQGYPRDSAPWFWLLQDEGRRALEEGRSAEALALFEQARRMRAQAFGENPMREGEAAALVGQALVRLERPREALRTLEPACQALSGSGALEPSLVLEKECLPALASAHSALGWPARALRLHEQALEGLARKLGPDHYDVATERVDLAQTLTRLGRAHEALPHAETAQALLEAALGERAPAVARARLARGEALLALARPREALPLLALAARSATERLLPPHEQAHVHFAHARALREAGEAAPRVREAAEAALAACARAPHPDVAAEARIRRWLSERSAPRGS